jgi:hypothetical protein
MGIMPLTKILISHFSLISLSLITAAGISLKLDLKKEDYSAEALLNVEQSMP